jgi:FimV-like protein
MSLVLPGAAFALGLGDIRIKSALHEPLAAEIELIGATDDDLAALSAGMADAETFERYGLERPLALSTTTFQVGKDSRGDPVISLRSTDALREPVLTFLVNVRSPSGELVREYSILLDPPVLAPTAGNFAVAPAAGNLGSETVASPASPAVSPSASPAVTSGAVTRNEASERPEPALEARSTLRTYRVVPRDTLERIARIAGAHSGSERRRMMIAIFRANPDAFRNNLNILRSGVTLRLPGAPELSAISADEAGREFALQMRAARGSEHRVPAPTEVTAHAVPDVEPVPGPAALDNSKLTQRVASLEKSLEDVRQELTQTLAKQASMRTAIGTPPAAIPTEPRQTEKTARGFSLGTVLATLTGGLVLMLAAAWLHRRRQKDSHGALSHSAPTMSWNTAGADDMATSAKLPPDVPVSGTVAAERLDVSKPDDDITSTHLVLTGEFNQQAPFVERRKSPADVLRQAIEREPHRSDLRLKLIELYYTAASQNRRAFVEATRQLAGNPQLLSEEDWSQILEMGRMIALDDELFAAPLQVGKAVA